MKRVAIAAMAAVPCLLAAPALAHTGAGTTTSLGAGLAHPLGGLDHLLAMLAVGLSAALIGGRALWAMPLAFMGAMALGWAGALAGLHLPDVELGIGLSVVALGALAAAGASAPLAVGVTLAAGFAVFHGHAHGGEMPAGASGLGYAAGFLAATGGLHLGGIGLGLGVMRLGPVAARALGLGVTATGLGLLAGAG